MINYFKFAHDFTICLDELQALSDLTLSDDPGPPDEPSDPTDEPSDPTDEPSDPTDEPSDPTDRPSDPTDRPSDPTDRPSDAYSLKKFTERFRKEYEDHENFRKRLLNQFLLPPIL